MNSVLKTTYTAEGKFKMWKERYLGISQLDGLHFPGETTCLEHMLRLKGWAMGTMLENG